MGNTFFCNRCDIQKFQVTRQCADQFLNDDKENLSSEQRWIMKLKCLDDAHSKHNGLTQEAFNEYVDILDKIIKSRKVPVYCKNRDLLIGCLERNPNCMLNCSQEVEDFVNCVDTLRIRRIKERIKESQAKKKHKI